MEDEKLKTTIYIDGYNLYFGLVKNTSYKWLNLISLFSEIIKIQKPQSSIVNIKYFTAPVITRFSSHKEESQASQNHYHRALQLTGGSNFEIINGYFEANRSTPPIYQKTVDLENKAIVWKLEEKQTDVNIALEMYRDAFIGKVEQQVLISNDSDLIPALKLITQDVSNIEMGLILPKKKSQKRQNANLSQLADWVRRHVTDLELERHQLPNMIPTNKKPIYKPKYW